MERIELLKAIIEALKGERILALHWRDWPRVQSLNARIKLANERLLCATLEVRK